LRLIFKSDNVEDLRIKFSSLFHSAVGASANAWFPNFLRDSVTTKLAGDEDCRARLDWRDEQGVISEEI